MYFPSYVSRHRKEERRKNERKITGSFARLCEVGNVFTRKLFNFLVVIRNNVCFCPCINIMDRRKKEEKIMKIILIIILIIVLFRGYILGKEIEEDYYDDGF